jgi:sortase A
VAKAAVPAENLIGMLDIPRLRLSTPVVTGDDDKTLQVAVGHLPDTPRPWEPGNSALAAHRDGLFRPLKNIRLGDALRVRTTHGNLEYRVRDIKIVTPDDLSVLEPTSADTLTLITCYPFNYIGAAPKRFIVQAERVFAEGTKN